MFGFIISLAILWPPPLAAHFHTPPVQEYTIQSNFSFKTEEDCHEKVTEFLDYVREATHMAKMAVNVNCYAEGVVAL